ncbi:TldD protein [Parasporobacterium paucivorans DSM 15970]|uniref:TldD protein n=2 Tax=Parasporobacterium TaxID=115543 RepID=A0A1M6D3M3_9FIRM|nr:TldD protein [Parasporobacterium paucivorans DSM 15970]
MKVEYSGYLGKCKPLIRKLVEELSKDYGYVSVLGTDTKGRSYRVSRTGTIIKDYDFGERGFVVRIHNGINYSEYSFNEIKEENLGDIMAAVHSSLGRAGNLKRNIYDIIVEDEVAENFQGEMEVNPEELGQKAILADLTDIRDKGLAESELVVNFSASYSSSHVSKLFLSGKKELEQSYMLGEARLLSLAARNGKIKYYYKSASGMKGYEVMDEIRDKYRETVQESVNLLDAKPFNPGEYDVICAPDITGLIAHEAFGHGVEMDMFVRERSKGADYLGKQVASELITMHDGATAAKQVSSYLFDDEGVMGTDTVIIEKGILKAGISDILSAGKLGTNPTGNGKRESYERKAYARMTNTCFEAGESRVEDMIASIKCGYLLEGMYSGMEDPKDWGIQCIALLGREIRDGKLTGELISPVVMTGFVPDLLKSISMISDKVEMEGAGYCGKGYKEFVKTSNGGPYIKAKVRLG